MSATVAHRHMPPAHGALHLVLHETSCEQSRSMKCALVAILMLLLAAWAGDALGEERSLGREPLEGKRRLAPIRGRRLAPGRAEGRNRDDAADRKREESDRHDRSDGRGRGGDKDDAEDE